MPCRLSFVRFTLPALDGAPEPRRTGAPTGQPDLSATQSSLVVMARVTASASTVRLSEGTVPGRGVTRKLGGWIRQAPPSAPSSSSASAATVVVGRRRRQRRRRARQRRRRRHHLRRARPPPPSRHGRQPIQWLGRNELAPTCVKRASITRQSAPRIRPSCLTPCRSLVRYVRRGRCTGMHCAPQRRGEAGAAFRHCVVAQPLRRCAPKLRSNKTFVVSHDAQSLAPI